LSQKYPRIPDLKNAVEESSRRFGDDRFSVAHAAPDVPLSQCDFQYCRSPRLRPTLAADGALYPCAHTANSKFEPFGNLLGSESLIDLYQRLFSSPLSSHVRVDSIGCGRECPPVIGRSKVLPPEFFVLPVEFARAMPRTPGWGKVSFSTVPELELYRDRWDLIRDFLDVPRSLPPGRTRPDSALEGTQCNRRRARV